MKRIVVTGGAGFIGSNYVRHALNTYPDLHIVNVDKLTYAGNLENLKGVGAARHTFIKADIADAVAMEHAMQGCDAIVNFAADSHVDRSIMEASDFIATNVRGVHNILEAAKKLGTKRVLLVSTDEVYGSIDKGSFKESDPANPRNPYSASKAGGELLGMSYFHTFNLPVIITRGSNTYGPYQYPEKVLPLFVTNAIDNEPVPLYGDGKNVRDWLYVEDHARGIDHALRHGEPGNIYNIAGENERENIVLTHRILKEAGRGPELIKPVKDRAGHDRRYSIDSSKLKALGWEPLTEWDEGIASTVKWYRDNEWWWRPIKSGAFREYYKRQYEDRETD
ncbi:MAG: dTDP-glucose 4,6-dehydratase [Candidatus Hydrogenedentes bacterium]|nr:dTDP-glucose 4,6-dehydratase [Candidatus Hydrogenedentota bacterium]